MLRNSWGGADRLMDNVRKSPRNSAAFHSITRDACPRFSELQSFKAEKRVQMNCPLKLHSKHAHLC